MHIDKSYLTNRTVGQPEEATAPADAPRRGAVPVPPPEASLHVPSAELVALVARVVQEPEVRPEVLQRVAQRLASGYYLTRDAAERTAEAFLDSEE